MTETASPGSGDRIGDSMALTVLIHGEPHEYPITDWAELSRQFGPQEAKYRKEKLQSNPEANKVHCQECGKVCTKARGGMVLTRSTVVCGKCYDESKHGACSSVSNYYR